MDVNLTLLAIEPETLVTVPTSIHPPAETTAAPASLEVDVREALLRELGALYGELDAVIAADNPLCRTSGDCCQFGKYGHRLYATRAEAQYFALRRGWPAQEFSMESCPYLRDNRCTARDARPLGCRVFFCDPAWRGKGEDLTERYLRRIGALSERLGIERDYRPFLEHLNLFRTSTAPAEGQREGSWPS